MMNDDIKEILDRINNYPEKLYCLNEKLYCLNENEKHLLLDYITNLQQKYDRVLEDSVKETYKLKAIRKYLKNNEREYGSLEDNEKIILGIIEGKYDEQ